MKKVKVTLAVLVMILATAFFEKASAQITLDTTVTPQLGIGDSFYTQQISATETKYVWLDTVTNTFMIYNMDFTPFISNISVPEPFIHGTTFRQPLYVTRSLFDCDSSNIEFMYENPTIPDTFYIMRTDGTILFTLGNANGPFCAGSCEGLSDYTRPIRNTSAGAKLFLQNGSNSISIYSLCGTLPEDVFDYKFFNETYIKIFPNPSSNSLNFQINVPDNINEYDLVILDNNAREVKRVKVQGKQNYNVDMSNFSSGTYYYSLCTKSKAYQSGKFIISK